MEKQFLVEVKSIEHKGECRYFLFFPFNPYIQSVFKQITTDVQYSNTYKAWHIPHQKEILKQAYELLKNKVAFNWEGIKTESKNPDQIAFSSNASIKKNQSAATDNKRPLKTQSIQLPVLDSEKQLKTEFFKKWMLSKRYSNNTISTYLDGLYIFLRYHSHKKIEEIDNNDLIDFNNHYILDQGLSASFQNQVINAVKLFFKSVESRKLDVDLIHRPRRAKLLPNVLSKEEVKKLLDSLNNIKHKVMLSLIYSCGLRCGELLRLKPEHIDAQRKLIIIRQAKGKKDRIVPLSEKILGMLRVYWEVHKPKVYLFEGQQEGATYDERSLQQVLKNAVYKADIKKPVTLHWLRHSYATHLLENGTDLRYIQEILGHRSSKTTEIYTHVSTKGIQNVVSPFDYL